MVFFTFVWFFFLKTRFSVQFEFIFCSFFSLFYLCDIFIILKRAKHSSNEPCKLIKAHKRKHHSFIITAKGAGDHNFTNGSAQAVQKKSKPRAHNLLFGAQEQQQPHPCSPLTPLPAFSPTGPPSRAQNGEDLMKFISSWRAAATFSARKTGW